MNESNPEYQRLIRHVRDNHIGGIHWGTWSLVHETVFPLKPQAPGGGRIPAAPHRRTWSRVWGFALRDVTFWPWAHAVGAKGRSPRARRQGEVEAERRARSA